MQRNLATYFLASMEANNLDAILHSQVSEKDAKEDVIAVARLVKRCLNVTGKMRPTMKEVAMELETLRITKRSSVVNDGPEEEIVFETKPAMFSDIEYTCTTKSSSSKTNCFVSNETYILQWYSIKHLLCMHKFNHFC